MSVGAGIFLSAMLLSTVILFAVTKDRWNWKRIAKWGLLLPVALIALLSAAVYVYSQWESRPTQQTAFYELQLRAAPADVKFAKGEPTSTDGPERWIYHVGSGSAGKEAAQYLLQFKNGRVRFILYTAHDSQIVNPYLLGFTIGSSYQRIQEELGAPTHVSKSADDLDRMLSYDKLNAFFSFRQAQLVAYGIYDPQEGPMQFRSDPAASAPTK